MLLQHYINTGVTIEEDSFFKKNKIKVQINKKTTTKQPRSVY